MKEKGIQQRRVLDGIREGKSNRQIAHDMGLSEKTIKAHATNVFRALGVKTRTQAALASYKDAKSAEITTAVVDYLHTVTYFDLTEHKIKIHEIVESKL